VSTIIGVAPAGAEISTRTSQLVTGRAWRGSAFGGIKGRTELSGLLEDYLAGKMKVDEYVTHNRMLGGISEGFHDTHATVFIALWTSSSEEYHFIVQWRDFFTGKPGSNVRCEVVELRSGIVTCFSS